MADALLAAQGIVEEVTRRHDGVRNVAVGKFNFKPVLAVEMRYPGRLACAGDRGEDQMFDAAAACRGEYRLALAHLSIGARLEGGGQRESPRDPCRRTGR